MMKRTSSINSHKGSAGQKDMASSPNSGVGDSGNPPPPLNPDEEFTFDIDTMELETGDEESCCGTVGSMSVSALGTLGGGGASRSISLNQAPIGGGGMRSSSKTGGVDGGGGTWTVHGGAPVASSPRGMGSSDLIQVHATAMTSSPILFASSGRGSVMRNQPNSGVPSLVVTQSTKIGAKSASTSNSTNKGSNSSSSAQSKRGREKPQGSPNPAPPPQQQQQQHQYNGTQNQHSSPWPTPPARVDDWGASGNSTYGGASALSSVNAVGNRSVSGTDFRIVSVTSANNNMYYNSGHDMQHQMQPHTYGGNNSGSRTSLTSFHGVVVADNNMSRATATGSANSSTLNDIPHALIHHSDTGSHVSERSSVTPYENISPVQPPSAATPTRNTGKMMIGRPRGSQPQQPIHHQNYNPSNGGGMGPVQQQRSPDHSQNSNSRQGSTDYGPPPAFSGNNGMQHHHHIGVGVGGQHQHPHQQSMGLQIGQYPNQQNHHYAPPQQLQQPPAGGIKIQVGSYAPIKFAPSVTVGGKMAGAPPQPR